VKVGQAEERLRTMLRDAGLVLDRLDPGAAWRTFLAFAAEPVEGTGPHPEDDMCLFECGVYDWSDGKGARFNWGFCRQFSLYDEAGEYDRMEQLHCDLFFEATPELDQLQEAGIWSGPDLAEWAVLVEATEGFRVVMGLTPVESRVEQWEV
jgi:hypothetical protein